ncbi:RDD family protein [Halomicroarcula sp. GCM10025894]
MVTQRPEAADTIFIFGTLVAAVVVIVGYSPILEAVWNGQTVGKRLLGIRVVTEAGDEIGVRKALVRNIPAITAGTWLGYLVALASMAMSDRRQRLFDILAGTVVVSEGFSAKTDAATDDPTATSASGGQTIESTVDDESGVADDGWDDDSNMWDDSPNDQ